MSLPEKGIYIITSGVDGAAVGCYMVEDKSLLPKCLYVFPPGVEAQKFVIEKTDKGYMIKTSGAPTGVYNGYVCAFLPENEEGIVDWIITPQPHQGPNVYTITGEERLRGWTVDGENEEGGRKKVIFSPLIVGPLPPTYPPTEVWNIVRVDREE